MEICCLAIDAAAGLSDILRGSRDPEVLGLDAPRALPVRADEMIKRRRFAALHESAVGPDSVAKLGKRRLTRNNRIGAKDLLNRCCALVAVLESMLPARATQNSFATESPY